MLNFLQADRIDSIGIYPTTAGIGSSLGIAETDHGQYDEQRDVFGACAGAAFYRRSMLEEIGFFDSDFFAYYEDLDLAWRARLNGWKAVTAPRALVYHVHSATAGRMSNFTVYHTHRNKWYVIIKNWPLSLVLRYLPLIIAYDAAALLLAAIKGKIIPALRARLHLLVEIPRLLRKRKKVMTLRKVTTNEIKQLLMPTSSPMKILRRKLGSGI
jgi:GT2 family glycosyltransferase